MRGLLWPMTAGLLFVSSIAPMRGPALQLDPFQTQFPAPSGRFALVLLPFVRAGVAAYRPREHYGQFARGAVHTFGLCLWFVAIPGITLADTTPLIYRADLHHARRLAGVSRADALERCGGADGFGGVLIVVAPKLVWVAATTRW